MCFPLIIVSTTFVFGMSIESSGASVVCVHLGRFEYTCTLSRYSLTMAVFVGTMLRFTSTEYTFVITSGGIEKNTESLDLDCFST